MGTLLRRLRYWFAQRQHEDALQEELEFHRTLKQQALEADGVPADEARIAVSREIGNVTQAREDARAQWIWPWLDSVRQDTRCAVRGLLRQPGFTLLSVIVLGVAIGLNTSLFTVFAGLALRPMAGLTDGDRVVTVSGIERDGGRASGMSYPEFQALAAGSRSLDGLSATRSTSVSVEAGGSTRSTVTHAVSGNYFDVLGVRMQHGRGFRPEEDRAGSPVPVVILSHRLWEARFGANPAIVGMPVRVNDAAYTVVGIASPAFTGAEGVAMAAWVPIASLPVLRAHDPGERLLLTQANDCCVRVVGRLAAGASRAEAEAELQVLSNRFRAAASQPTRPIVLDGTQFLRERLAESTEVAIIGVLFVAVVLVLLLACANVGNLVLARAAARSGEIGVRMSLGAGRSRIVRQLLTEGFVLALLAGAVGVAVAVWVPDLVINRLAGQSTPFDIAPDLGVVVYALVLAGIACLTFALTPALHATRSSALASLKQTTPRAGVRLRSVLLGIQVAVTVVLLTSAGLLIRGVAEARAMDPGFRIDAIAIATFELPEGAYDITRSTAFLADLTSGLRDAGLTQFGFASTEPLSGLSRFAGVRRPGEGKERTQGIKFMSVSPDYFETLGIGMAAGRAFAVGDEQQHVAIVNASAARRIWGGQPAVGQSLVVAEGDSVQVVGVVEDAYIYSLDEMPPLLFLPLARAQADDFPRLLFTADQPAAGAAVRSLVGRMDRRARVEIQPLGDRLNDQLAKLALAPLAASVLGLFGLGLATVGMFGVFGYVVRQRTREIGIRIALGARSSEITRLVLAGSSRPVIAGLALGILGSLGASQVLRGALHGVSPLDPVTYGGVALLLAAAAMAASYLPARRAAHLSPTQALRE